MRCHRCCTGARHRKLAAAASVEGVSSDAGREGTEPMPCLGSSSTPWALALRRYSYEVPELTFSSLLAPPDFASEENLPKSGQGADKTPWEIEGAGRTRSCHYYKVGCFAGLVPKHAYPAAMHVGPWWPFLGASNGVGGGLGYVLSDLTNVIGSRPPGVCRRPGQAVSSPPLIIDTEASTREGSSKGPRSWLQTVTLSGCRPWWW